MLGWMKQLKLELSLPGEISTASDDATVMAESEEDLSLLIRMKEESGKAGLKLNIQKH